MTMTWLFVSENEKDEKYSDKRNVPLKNAQLNVITIFVYFEDLLDMESLHIHQILCTISKWKARKTCVAPKVLSTKTPKICNHFHLLGSNEN